MTEHILPWRKQSRHILNLMHVTYKMKMKSSNCFINAIAAFVSFSFARQNGFVYAIIQTDN